MASKRHSEITDTVTAPPAGAYVALDVPAPGTSSKILAEKLVGGLHTLWVPAGAMIPSITNGCEFLTNVEIAANQPNVASVNFDASTDKFAQFSIAMPKSWDRSTITAEFYWSHAGTTVNFAVVWGLQAVAVSNDDALGVAFGTAQTVTDTGGTTNDQYVSPATSAITVGGTPADGDIVHFQVFRDADNVSDTMAINARLHGIKIMYNTTVGNDN